LGEKWGDKEVGERLEGEKSRPCCPTGAGPVLPAWLSGRLRALRPRLSDPPSPSETTHPKSFPLFRLRVHFSKFPSPFSLLFAFFFASSLLLLSFSFPSSFLPPPFFPFYSPFHVRSIPDLPALDRLQRARRAPVSCQWPRPPCGPRCHGGRQWPSGQAATACGPLRQRDQGAKAPRRHGAKGPRAPRRHGAKGAREPRGQGAKAPRGQGAKGPRGQGAKGPRGQGATGPRSHGAKEPRGPRGPTDPCT